VDDKNPVSGLESSITFAPQILERKSATYMSITGPKNPKSNLESLGIKNTKKQFWNLTAEELIEETIKRNQGVLSDTGALAVDTGEFTGRSPKD